MASDDELSARRKSALGENDPRNQRVVNVWYRATALVRCLPTAIIHFLLVETRSIWLVWFTGYLTAIQSQKFRFEKYLWTFSNIFGTMNCIVFIYVASFVFLNLVCMKRQCGWLCAFEDGHYLAFSYDLETSKTYRVGVVLLTVLISVVFVLSFIFLCFWVGEDDEKIGVSDFFTDFGANFFMVVGMSGALMLQESKIYKDSCCKVNDMEQPDVNWKTDTFQNIKYTRTIRDLFMETNDSFAARLTLGCWKATGKNPNFRTLRNYVHDDFLEEALNIEPN